MAHVTTEFYLIVILFLAIDRIESSHVNSSIEGYISMNLPVSNEGCLILIVMLDNSYEKSQ